MNASALFVTLFDVVSHAPRGSSLSLVTCHPCSCAFLLEFTSLFFHFDLSFTVLSFFFPLLHFELHTELDNLIAVQNLRNSANKGSNDAYDVSVSLTESVRSSFGRTIMERQFEKILLQHGWEKTPNWECLFVHREKYYSYLCMWMT